MCKAVEKLISVNGAAWNVEINGNEHIHGFGLDGSAVLEVTIPVYLAESLIPSLGSQLHCLYASVAGTVADGHKKFRVLADLLDMLGLLLTGDGSFDNGNIHFRRIVIALGQREALDIRRIEEIQQLVFTVYYRQLIAITSGKSIEAYRFLFLIQW
jgi:hypothetical protein